ncbi:phage tail tape measure protein, partial [Veronia pacifica]
MSEKISFEIAAAVKGLKKINATTEATKQLSEAVEEQREEVKNLNAQMKKADAYAKSKQRLKRLGGQLDNTKEKMASLGEQYDAQKQHNIVLRNETLRTEREIASLKKEMQSASKEGAQVLSQKISMAETKLEGLGAELDQSRQKALELKAALGKTSQSVQTLTDRKIKQINKTRDLRSQLRQAGVNTKDLASEQQRLAKETEKATQKLGKQGQRLRETQGIQGRIDARNGKFGELGGEAAGLAVKAAPIVGSVAMAMKNESTFADVKKVVDMTPEQSQALREWSLKMSASKDGGGMGANEINAMLAAGGQSGIKDIAELKRFVLDSAQMGVAFDMEAEDAGQTLATFKASMGLDQSGAMSLAGLSNYLSNNSNAKAKDIAAVMARQGATATTSGFTVNEAAALSSSLLSMGMGEERSATALKNISGRLTLGDAASGSQKRSLNRIGFDAQALSVSMQQDASGTLIQVLDAISAAPLEEQSALITQIFGEEAKGAVASLAGNTSVLTKALKLARDGEQAHLQSLQTEFAARIDTSANSWDVFTNKLSRLSVVFGNSLLPALNAVLEPVGELVDWLADFAQKNEQVTAAIGITAAGLGALKVAMLAGKAAALLMGNTFDKGRLFRNRLKDATHDEGRAAAYATRQLRRFNRELRSTPSGRRERGDVYTETRSGRDKRKTETKTEPRSRPRRRRRGLRGVLDRSIDWFKPKDKSPKDKPVALNKLPPASTPPLSKSNNTSSPGSLGLNPSSMLDPKLAALSLAGGGVAMAPMGAIAEEAIGIGGDVADVAGKMGISKVLKPLGMAMSGVQITQGLIEGDNELVGEAAGDIGGSLAGGAAGAAIGTMIFPGVGTVVGG